MRLSTADGRPDICIMYRPKLWHMRYDEIHESLTRAKKRASIQIIYIDDDQQY